MGIERMKLNFYVLALAGLASATKTTAKTTTKAASTAKAAAGGASTTSTTVAAGGKNVTTSTVASMNNTMTNSTMMAGNVTEAANAANVSETTTKKGTPKPEPENGAAVATMSLGSLLAVYFAL